MLRPTNPSWLYEGQIVYVDASLATKDAKPGQGLPCRVTAACGDAGRVVSTIARYPFEQLMLIDDLWVGPLTKGGAYDRAGRPVKAGIQADK